MGKLSLSLPLSRCPARSPQVWVNQQTGPSQLRQHRAHVSTGSWAAAGLLAGLSFRCGLARADSGRNTASHRVMSLAWRSAGFYLDSLPVFVVYLPQLTAESTGQVVYRGRMSYYLKTQSMRGGLGEKTRNSSDDLKSG